MREAIYNALVNKDPDEIKKIKNTKDGWFRYWTKVLQTKVIYSDLIIIDFL